MGVILSSLTTDNINYNSRKPSQILLQPPTPNTTTPVYENSQSTVQKTVNMYEVPRPVVSVAATPLVVPLPQESGDDSDEKEYIFMENNSEVPAEKCGSQVRKTSFLERA